MLGRAASFPILAYHGIRPAEAGTLPSGWNPEYTIDSETFVEQLDLIRTTGCETIGLGDCAGRRPTRGPLLITFDDAHFSDYVVAGPELNRRGLKAVFYIPWSFLGRSGYMSRDQVRELAAHSFEIGSHGLTHKNLIHMSPTELWREALDSKRKLEELTGTPVCSFAIPWGSYNDLVLQALLAAGYTSIMTSDPGPAKFGHHVMRRLGVERLTSRREFRQYLEITSVSAVGLRLFNGIRNRVGSVIQPANADAATEWNARAAGGAVVTRTFDPGVDSGSNP